MLLFYISLIEENIEKHYYLGLRQTKFHTMLLELVYKSVSWMTSKLRYLCFVN